ncbi:MAG: DUF1549 domain-containing protein [Acidobacteria bacterium]|nr:DUF1549 domain-containing protein [Acidobacteriota bacterium]
MVRKHLWIAVSCTLLATSLLLAGAARVEQEYRDSERSFWSLQPRSEPAVPEFSSEKDQAWVRNSVDAFVLARLKKEGLRPAPEADRATLIRRVTFDLTGLPPTPSDVADFVNDHATDAFEKVVDRLLASPQYGERWGLHWLDAVRYAETEGFEYDRTVHGSWRFRDYVIKSFNDDKPFNQFMREQIAGDEIGPDNEETQIAAGFYRLGAVRRNAGNQEVASSRNEVLTDRTDIIGAAFLGLTVACARCHDHMFDPIRQKDYYRLQAFLAATQEYQIVVAPKEEQEYFETTTKAIEGKIKKLRGETKGLTDEEKKEAQKKVGEQIKELQAQLPEPLPAIASIKNDPENRSPIHVLNRGNYDQKGDAVGMRPLGVLLPDGAPELPIDSLNPKTYLANWLAEPDHPLTARVAVNRVWAFHFGQGIVNTPNDFGFMGDRPSHPELLDHLANKFVANGWHTKPMHRMMVLSSTYRQSSLSPDEKRAADADPDNRLLWKFNKRRLEAEEIRDAMLAVSGKLNLAPGGESIMIPVEQELVDSLYAPHQWVVAADPSDHYRRSVYLIAKRNLRLPFMEVFDQPALLTACARRESSTHAPQALELLNGQTSNGLAEEFAKRLRHEVGTSPEQQAERAYLLAVGRLPTNEEKRLAVEFIESQPAREFALAMFNLNAFLYVN